MVDLVTTTMIGGRAKRWLDIGLTALSPVPLIFLAPALHTPLWLVIVITLLNWGIAYCYWLIPQTIQVDSKQGIATIEKALVPGFVAFFHGCGMHHRIHMPAMILMMAGFATMNMWLAWLGAGLMLLIDGLLFVDSLQTARAFALAKKRLWGLGSES